MGLRLNGSTSGYVELNAPAVAGTTVLELPTDSIKPGMVLVASQSVGAASTVSFNSCFSATYDWYRIACSYASSVTNGINMRMRAAGADNTSNLYYLQRVIANGSNLTATRPVNPDTFFGGFIQGATNRNNFTIDIADPFAGARTSLLAQALLGSPDLYLYSGLYDGTTSFDGFTLYTTTGTITGTVRVYGYRNS
jgi:hypothetical protein